MRALVSKGKTAVAFAVFLWLAFSFGGLALHHACKTAPANRLGWVDVAGYDSEGFVRNYTLVSEILSVNHRHPLVGPVMSPIIAVGATVAQRAGDEAGRKAVICCFALVGAVSFVLLWLVLAKAGASLAGRLAAAALWLSFAHVWILGGVAESFGISQMLLLGVLLMVLCEVRDMRAWAAMTAVAGALTVTNAVKPFVAWLVSAGGWGRVRQLNRRLVFLLLAGGVGVVALTVAALLFKWAYVNGVGAWKGTVITIHEVTDCLPQGMGFTRRLWLAWNAFWCEPMIVREPVIAKSYVTASYRTVGPHLVCIGVLALCVWSAVRNFRLPVVRAALAMVAFDVLLHAVVGWGVDEGQIYCGHWFWIVPLLVSLLPPKAALATAALAVACAGFNLAQVL